MRPVQKSNAPSGGPLDDFLSGDSLDNRILGFAGNDTLSGAGGADSVYGGLGHDEFVMQGGDLAYGGDGNDVFFNYDGDKSAADTEYGGAGEDTFVIDLFAGAAEIFGGSGTDTLIYNASPTVGDLVLSFADPNAVILMPGGQRITGVEQLVFHADDYSGRVGSSTITGGDFNDSIEGGLVQTDLYGGGGNDSLMGGAGGGIATLDGGSGDDSLIFIGTLREGVQIIGGAGVDTFQWYSPDLDSGASILAATMAGAGSSFGGALISDIEKLSFIGGIRGDTVVGAGYEDTLSGGAGTESLRGAGGNDLLIGGYDNDTLHGQSGNDRLVDEVTHTTRGVSGGDVFFGGSGDDMLDGAAGWDRLYGGSGHDDLRGGTGNDRLFGGTGLDSLTGGDGKDAFGFDAAPVAGSVALITDFQPGADRLLLNAAQFGGHALGVLDAAEFEAAAVATMAATRILYDAASGMVGFDGDGLGGADAVVFAQVTANTALTAADIQFI